LNNKYEHKNILITGGCGFIGTNLAIYLVNSDYKVRILDKLLTNSIVWQEGGKINITHEPILSTTDLMVGDIRNSGVVEKAVDGIDAVVHLAAHTGVIDSLKNPKENWDTNVNGTINLLEACRCRGVNKFILASSNAAVGDQTPPIDELKVPQPMSPYGASKLAGEALCSAYYHSFGLNTICLRFANCYGPYSEHKTGVIPRYMSWVRKGEPLIIYGDGNQTRDFIHVHDICKAIRLALITSDSELQTMESNVFQIASGTETSINELAELIKEIYAGSRITGLNSQIFTSYKPKRKGEIERNYSDITKAKKILGFKPEFKLRDGLNQLYKLAEESDSGQKPG
jgi:UDP-glucose 4-epimerase